MPVPSADPTAPFDAPWGVPTTSLAAGRRAPAGGFDEELRRLLRSRLILVHLLALALGVLIVAVSFYRYSRARAAYRAAATHRLHSGMLFFRLSRQPAKTLRSALVSGPQVPFSQLGRRSRAAITGALAQVFTTSAMARSD